MAGNSGGNEFENVTFLTPDVAMLRSKLVRAGQKTSTGETMPDRHIHHLRVPQRRAGKWQIVSHLISQSHEKSKPTDKGKGKPIESNGDVRLPIIDVHVHVYAEDERWTYKVPNPVTGQTITATTEQAHMQATLAEMKKYNVVKAVVSNDYPTVQRWKSTFPEQIINSFGFNDPTTLDVAFLRKEYAAGRLKALGEIGAQYLGFAPNHPRLDPVDALAEELDIPVSIHIGLTKPGGIYGAYPNYRAAIGNPMLLEEVLIRHPKLRINVMHAGWPMSDQMVALMWAHPQVYVDTGVIDWALPRREFHSYLRRLVESGFGKRILFGSDQMVWPEAIGMAVEGIESATFLSEQQKRDIFYDNAVDFYRLDKE
jgi:predicted TIM-barrel fold metal-dependent hydrolase